MVACGTLTGQLYGIKRQAAGCSAPGSRACEVVVRCCELRWKGGKRRMQKGIAQKAIK